MTSTTNLNITLVAQNQAQKEVTVNEAISTIDAILNRGVVHRGTNTPPVSPAAGDMYIIGSAPTGLWLGKANNIAYYNTTWKFIVPNEGMTVWVNDENMAYSFEGSVWLNSINGALNNLPGVGVNSSYDAINKLSVKSSAVLFDNIGAAVQLKVNKNASIDTASYLFQDGYSGRAEFGLIGDDNFQLKVSPNGSSWYQSFVVDNASGNIYFKQALSLNGNITCSGYQLINPELKNYVITLTSASSGAAYTVNMQNGNMFKITRTGNCTYTFSNPPASGKGHKFTLILVQDATGGRTTTWPTSVKWPGGVAPTLTTAANAVDMLSFITTDGGATWYGKLEGLNIS